MIAINYWAPAAHSRRDGYLLCAVSLLVGWFRPWPMRQRISAVPQRIATKFAHTISVGQGWKPTFEIYFLQLLKYSAGKNSNLRQVIEDRRQSEARNFETAQHTHKRISDASSTINALQNCTKLGPPSHGVSMKPRQNIGKLWMTRRNVRVLPIAQNFLLVGP